MRFAPCPHPGCPELADRCARHRRPAWAGRNGTTRWDALGVSPRTWARLCRAAKARDGHRCRVCGADGTEVDHLVPLAWHRPPETYTKHLAALMTLCEGCHRTKTKREAVLSRTHGSPPPSDVISRHIVWWLGQASAASRIVFYGSPHVAR